MPLFRRDVTAVRFPRHRPHRRPRPGRVALRPGDRLVRRRRRPARGGPPADAALTTAKNARCPSSRSTCCTSATNASSACISSRRPRGLRSSTAALRPASSGCARRSTCVRFATCCFRTSTSTTRVRPGTSSRRTRRSACTYRRSERRTSSIRRGYLVREAPVRRRSRPALRRAARRAAGERGGDLGRRRGPEVVRHAWARIAPRELPARRRDAARRRRDGRPDPAGRVHHPARAAAGGRPRGLGRHVRRDPPSSTRERSRSSTSASSRVSRTSRSTSVGRASISRCGPSAFGAG